MTAESILLRASIICTILVAIGLFDLPYGYYMFLRLCLCGGAVDVIYLAFDSLHEVSRWLFGAIAVLYNPIIPIYLNDKSVWIVLNIITLVVFWTNFGMAYQVRANRPGNEGLPKTGRRDEWTADDIEAARSEFDAELRLSSFQPRPVLNGLPVTTNCFYCEKEFSFISGRLPIFENKKGRKGLWCKSCMNELNDWRIQLGLTPFKIDDGAYPEDCES